MHFDESPLCRLESSPSTPSVFLREMVLSTSGLQALRWREISNVWARRLDRVNVLGSEVHGHTGCVNALSWAQNGELLISSGDDQQLRVWRMTPSDPLSEYPFTCQTVIDTGHSGNVFNAQMLPSSTRIATVAGDRQVRVFDIGESVGRSPSGNEMRYSTRQACIRVLRCHSRRTKRIITEDSPDFFLTVAEDGEVRQHDLRTPHSCTRGNCPVPLVKLPHELSTIALSSLTPYQFVVGGESPFAHLFDRRHAGRYLREEWGMSPSLDDVTTCVRRFSRYARAPGERKGYEHITGAKMSASNGHELLLSFSSDAVYIYSTRDDPGASLTNTKGSLFLPPNSKLRREEMEGTMFHTHSIRRDEQMQSVLEDLEGESRMGIEDEPDNIEDMLEDEDEDMSTPGTDIHPDAAIVYPRIRFSGHCNVETVKDVNFLGPFDEYVTSGSDDGNIFIWKKSSGELVDILEGDDSVVNVIEGHPTLPLVAVSGIDTTIKLFAPARGRATYSRYQDAPSIMTRNARASRRGLDRSANLQLARLIMHQHDRALEILRNTDEGIDSDSRLSQCINQ